jgi:ABC-type transport system involved in multi-copper enzyme maturation permease subunit
MERIWKLTAYIFWIVASTALILLAYVLSGNQYSPFAVIMVYTGLAGLAIGIFGGLYTIVSNRTEPNETDSEEQT